MDFWTGLVALAAGFVAGCFSKDWLQEKLSDAEALAQSLEDKAKALRDKVKAVF